MKANYIGIIAGILALISLVLPWWTMAITGTFEFEVEGMKLEGTMSGDVSVYPYDARMTMGVDISDSEEDVGGERYTESVVDGFSIWYSYVALALISISGVAGIAGSLIVGKKGKIILLGAVILALLSIIIFATYLPSTLSNLTGTLEDEVPFFSGFPKVGLFSSGSFSSNLTEIMEETTEVGNIKVEMSYSTYLSFGFWLALVVAIIAFIALLKHPMALSKKKSRKLS